MSRKYFEVWTQRGKDTILIVRCYDSSIRYQHDPKGEWRKADDAKFHELFNQKPLFDCRTTKKSGGQKHA